MRLTDQAAAGGPPLLSALAATTRPINPPGTGYNAFQAHRESPAYRTDRQDVITWAALQTD
jgi:hypothetical protein